MWICEIGFGAQESPLVSPSAIQTALDGAGAAAALFPATQAPQDASTGATSQPPPRCGKRPMDLYYGNHGDQDHHIANVPMHSRVLPFTSNCMCSLRVQKGSSDLQCPAPAVAPEAQLQSPADAAAEPGVGPEQGGSAATCSGGSGSSREAAQLALAGQAGAAAGDAAPAWGTEAAAGVLAPLPDADAAAAQQTLAGGSPRHGKETLAAADGARHLSCPHEGVA